MSLSKEIREHIENENFTQLQEELKFLQPIQLADILASLPDDQFLKVFKILPSESVVSAYEWLPLALQRQLIEILPSNEAATLLHSLSPDDRVALLEDLPSPVIKQLLKLLPADERTETLKLLGYPEDSVGRLMTPDYIAIKMDWTVNEVLQYIREYGHDSETISILYVVDDQGRLIDDIRIRDFLFAAPEKKVADLVDHKFIWLNVKDDEETAINIFRKNSRGALPVIDDQGVLLGIVTIDDILHLAKAEDTEDMQKFGGVQALEEPYLRTPFLTLMRKRAGWLTVLFLGEMLTATAMGYFQDEISRAVVLALFLPLIMSSGGNSGSQAATLIICAMALGEVGLRDWWRIMRREICAGLFLGALLGAIAFLRISLWSSFSTVYGEHWLLIAVTIFFSLIGVVLWGTLVGSMLPILLRRVGADPAVSSTPFIATFIDVTGIVIYFSIALVLLKGTLL